MFDVIDDTWTRINHANLRVGWHLPTLAERDQIDALARDLNREFFPADPETARPRTAPMSCATR